MAVTGRELVCSECEQRPEACDCPYTIRKKPLRPLAELVRERIAKEQARGW